MGEFDKVDLSWPAIASVTSYVSISSIKLGFVFVDPMASGNAEALHDAGITPALQAKYGTNFLSIYVFASDLVNYNTPFMKKFMTSIVEEMQSDKYRCQFVELRPDPEMDVEYVVRIYGDLDAAANKLFSLGLVRQDDWDAWAHKVREQIAGQSKGVRLASLRKLAGQCPHGVGA